MQIPAFFATSVNRRTLCVDSFFEGLKPSPASTQVPLYEISNKIRGESRAPVVIMDHVSLRKGSFHGSLTKHVKVKGADVWLMSHIQAVEDVFDAFNGNVEMLLAPLHGILTDSELDDIHAVSDSFIPVVFCIESKAMGIGGKSMGIMDVMDYLADKGYYKICLMDLDGSISEEEWAYIADDHPSTIPFQVGEHKIIPGFEVTISMIELH